MNHELSFEAVIGRLKEELGADRDKDVASALGMSPQTFNNRKKTESVPYEEIVDRAVLSDMDIVYIFTGARADKPRAANEEGSPYETGDSTVNAELLAKVISAVDQELANRALQMAAEKKAELVAHLYEHFTARGVVDEKKFTRFMDLVLAR